MKILKIYLQYIYQCFHWCIWSLFCNKHAFLSFQILKNILRLQMCANTQTKKAECRINEELILTEITNHD